MSIFNRLFGSKKNNNNPEENQQKQQEIKENKINQNPDSSPNNQSNYF
jgi:hypothetical protein